MASLQAKLSKAEATLEEVRVMNKELTAAVSHAEKERAVGAAKAKADKTALEQDNQIISHR